MPQMMLSHRFQRIRSIEFSSVFECPVNLDSPSQRSGKPPDNASRYALKISQGLISLTLFRELGGVLHAKFLLHSNIWKGCRSRLRYGRKLSQGEVRLMTTPW